MMKRNWNRKLQQHSGETLLETLIGLVIIGLVMMCLPMAVTATADINGKVAEQDVVVTMDPANTEAKDAQVTITCLADNVGNKDSITADIAAELGTIHEKNPASTDKQVFVTGHLEKNRFYYYDFAIE